MEKDSTSIISKMVIKDSMGNIWFIEVCSVYSERKWWIIYNRWFDTKTISTCWLNLYDFERLLAQVPVDRPAYWKPNNRVGKLQYRYIMKCLTHHPEGKTYLDMHQVFLQEWNVGRRKKFEFMKVCMGLKWMQTSTIHIGKHHINTKGKAYAPW